MNNIDKTKLLWLFAVAFFVWNFQKRLQFLLKYYIIIWCEEKNTKKSKTTFCEKVK